MAIKLPAISEPLRTMIVNFGLTRSPSGEAPVPSVSYRWVDRLRSASF